MTKLCNLVIYATFAAFESFDRSRLILIQLIVPVIFVTRQKPILHRNCSFLRRQLPTVIVEIPPVL